MRTILLFVAAADAAAAAAPAAFENGAGVRWAIEHAVGGYGLGAIYYHDRLIEAGLGNALLGLRNITLRSTQ